MRRGGLEVDLFWAEGGAGRWAVDQADPQSVESDTIPERRLNDSVAGQMENDDVAGVIHGGVLPKISYGVLR